MITGLVVGCGDPEGYLRARDGGVAGTTAIGTTGAAGVTGSAPGSAGEAGGSTGLAGVPGTAGTPGLTGGGGAVGAAGTSGAAGTNGAAGTTGVAGVSGAAGTNGAAGTSGAAGASGAAGKAGTAGASGAAGTSGAAGKAGTAGTSGAAGTSGTAGATGTAGAGGMTVTGACAGKVKVATATIDTFEDGALTGWYEYKDATANTTLAPLAIVSPGANATAKAIHLQGSGFQGFGAGMGLMMACTDASAFQGVRFWAKGNSGTSNDVALQVAIPESQAVADLGDCTTKCFDHPSKAVLLTGTWQSYSVKFTDLAQAGFGTPATYRGLVMALNFVSLEGPTVDFQVDEIAFY